MIDLPDGVLKKLYLNLLNNTVSFAFKGNPFIFICDDRSSEMNHCHQKWNWRDFFLNWDEKLFSFWFLTRTFYIFICDDRISWFFYLFLLVLIVVADEKLRNHNTNEMVAHTNECLREWHYLLVALAIRMELDNFTYFHLFHSYDHLWWRTYIQTNKYLNRQKNRTGFILHNF